LKIVILLIVAVFCFFGCVFIVVDDRQKKERAKLEQSNYEKISREKKKIKDIGLH